MGTEPPRERPARALSDKMSRLARSRTAPEILLRRELHRRGLRFRTQVKVPGNRRRTIDIALTRAKVAVFVDGCFWHACPDHFTQPRANADWWRWKMDGNVARDRDTDELLRAAGWQVVRVWEHEDVVIAADAVQRLWRERTAST
ncbi:very short patch repair endonuclease [Nocardioides dongxiaopingii]|uniref:very short patch repair endonuclease n=1 Tax=Nocardioides sp. S-1144 TaxID=2582905 RepID=UPI0021CB8768|nr:very short patch repair endonuclease [Nocardioides sp. S-1144]